MTDKKKAKGVAEAAVAFEQGVAGRTLKVRRIGNSLGVVLPKDVLAKLRVGEGDELSVTETPDGVALTGGDAEFARQMEIMRDIMRRYRNTLRELAK